MAKQDLESAEFRQKNAQEDYNKAKADVTAQDEMIQNYQKNYDFFSENVKNAEKQVEKAQKDYENGKTERQLAQEELEDFEKKNPDIVEMAKSNNKEGTKNFFQYLKATGAVNELTNPRDKVKDYTQLGYRGEDGKEADATTLNNFNATFAYIEECNEIRKSLGLPELKVSAYLTAVAELNANYSHVNFSHSEAYKDKCGENLAFGSGEANTDRSPFKGWYDREKAIYDNLDEKYKNMSAYELSKKHHDIFLQVGHYLNIIQEDYKYTGFALKGDPTSFWDGNQSHPHSTFAQEFSRGEPVKDDVILTVSEFKQKYTEYFGKLLYGVPSYLYLQDKVNNASDTVSDAALVLAQENLKTQQKNLDDQAKVLEEAKSEKERYDKALEEANKELQKENKALKDAQDKYDDAQQNVSDSKKAFEEATILRDAKKKAKEDADAVCKDADNLVAEINNHHLALTNRFYDLNSARLDAQNFEARAHGEYSVSVDALNDAENDLKAKKEDYEKALETQKRVDEETKPLLSKLNLARKLLTEKNGKYDDAQAALNTYNEVVASRDELMLELDSQNDLIARYVQEQEEAKEAIQLTSEKIDALIAEKAASTEKSKGYELILSVINAVKKNGTKADISAISDEELLGLLQNLALEVDELNEIESKLASANVVYFNKLAAYEEAKKDEAQAKSVYDAAMKDLDKYIQENSKHAVKTDENNDKYKVTTTNKNSNTITTNSTKKVNTSNTGVETGLGSNVAMMGVAALGIVEAKRKSKKQ